ncbi:MAG TPA: GNAT family N-acetyltransferase [Candidatus Nanoarchaeia archaeon]|nr:GNAT family N-acetyltransferase [Candidatus Nanoarchaeia archaeon]
MEKEIVDPSEQYTLVPLRELDLENESDLTAYFQMLTHPSNIEHVVSPPEDPADLKRKLLRDRTFNYIAENMVGEIVGAGGIKDASQGEHDHFLVNVVVNPDYKGTEIEKNLFGALTDKAFATSARDERERFKLDVLITRDVQDWHRAPPILEELGYTPLGIYLKEVDVFNQRLGRIVVKPRERWEIQKSKWLSLRENPSV